MSPPTVGREEPPEGAAAARPSLKLRPRPLSEGWLKEAGLCCGGVLWKEREELLRDGLPERSSWGKITINNKLIVFGRDLQEILKKRNLDFLVVLL